MSINVANARYQEEIAGKCELHDADELTSRSSYQASTQRSPAIRIAALAISSGGAPLPNDPSGTGFVAPTRPRRSGFTAATGLSVGAAALLAFLLFLKGAPWLAYQAHVPIELWYAVFVGTLVGGYLVRRRWRAVLPRDSGVAFVNPARARLPIAKLAFRLLPAFGVVGVAAWIGIINNGPKATLYVAIGFAFVWSLVWARLWYGVVLPALTRR